MISGGRLGHKKPEFSMRPIAKAAGGLRGLFNFDPDQGVGEGNRLYAAGAALASMGMGDPSFVANATAPLMRQNRERVAAEAKKRDAQDELARRASLLDSMGLSPQQRAAAELSPDKAAEHAFAGPADPLVINDQIVDRQTHGVLGDYRTPEPDALQFLQSGENWAVGNKTKGIITPTDAPLPPQTPQVAVNVGGDPAAGQRPIVADPPKDFQRVWDAEAQTYRDIPIPGSESERDRASEGVKAMASVRASAEQTQTMFLQIDKAIEQAGGWSAGLMAQATAGIASTPARNLRATLDTIVANIGFDKLQEMRENSPTGGALGQVTEKELAFLQAVRGSLDQLQSPEQLRETLKQVKASLERLQSYREAAYELRYGQAEPGMESPVVQPDGDIGSSVQEGKTRFKFNPETGGIE